MSHDIAESEHVELKTSTSELKEAIISLAAILNKHGKGELYFGIKDNSKVIGQQVSSQTLRKVSQTIANAIEPKIYPEVSKIEVEGKTCLKVVFSGSEMPYFAYGRAYIRVGDEDRTLSAKELEKMILKKNREGLRWDSSICEEASIDDIDPEKVKTFIEKAGSEFIDLQDTLETAGLLRNNRLTNAAIILFGKQPQDYFPNARLRCAVFGTTNTVVPIDMKDFEGDLFCLIEDAEKYILEHINIGMRLEGLYRVDVPEIDKEAFREAIINAFCHRNYFEYDSVNIAIFRDRLEIRNPGGLYDGLTINQITSKRISKRRNEVIADIFHRIHFVEKWGRGIELILSKEPGTTFEVIANMFVATFPRKGFKGYDEADTIQKTTQKTTPNQKAIIEYLRSNPSASRKELTENLVDISESGIKYNLKRLQELGLIRRVGSTKGGHWDVIEEGTTQKISSVATQKTTQKTTPNQKAIIDYLRSNPSASRKELTENLTDISESGIKYNLKRLQELGLIRRVGSTKGGHWEVIKEKE